MHIISYNALKFRAKNHPSPLTKEMSCQKDTSTSMQNIILPSSKHLFTSRKTIFYDNFVSFWTCHSKHLRQFGRVILNIHVTLDISCHFGQCHKRSRFLLVFTCIGNSTYYCTKFIHSSLLLPSINTAFSNLNHCKINTIEFCTMRFRIICFVKFKFFFGMHS